MEVFNSKPQSEAIKQNKLSLTAKSLITITGGIGLGITVVCASFVAPAFRRFCLPWIPATPNQIENVLSVLPKKSTGKLLDIGSGDGRLVVAASKHGLEAHGVELNSWLVLYSRLYAFRANVFNKTKFFRRDLWKFDTSPYNFIVIFGVEQMMNDLQNKLIKEVNPGSKIIACRFPLPGLQPDEIIGAGVDTVWLYTIPKNNT